MSMRTMRGMIFLPICLATLAASPGAKPAWVYEAIAYGKLATPHEDAPAILLLKSADVEIKRDGSANRTVREVYNILSPQYSEDFRFVEWVNSDRKLKSLKGWRVDPKGHEFKLKKENIAQIGLQQSSGYYDDQKQVVAFFDDLKSGDVVAFEYKIKQKKGIDGLFQNFLFQSDLPVIHARFTVIIPEDWELHKSSRNLDPIEFVQNSNQYEWRAENLEYRPDEPLMPPWSRLNRKLSVSAYDPSTGGAPQFSNWQAVSKWAGELHRNPTNVNDSLAQLVASLTDDLPTKRGKLGAIARYLQEEIRYVAVEFGVGRFQPRMATTTFFNKYGDCKDKVTLMRAMLAQAGISAEPVLALVGGRVDRAFPTPFQFNHVILGVPLSEFTSHRGWAGAESDGWLFFDPTDESTPVGCLPLQLYDSRVLPATSSDSHLVVLPEVYPEDRRRNYNAIVSLSDDGSITAQVRITDFGIRALSSDRWRQRTTVEDQVEYLTERFAKSMLNIMIYDYDFGRDDDSAWVTFGLSGSDYISKSGEFNLVKADFFHPDEKGSLTKKKGRVHDVWFGKPRLYETTIYWNLPEGWSVSDGLDSSAGECDIAHASSDLSYQDGKLRFYSVITYDGGVVPVESYKQARKFDRKVSAIKATKMFISKQ